jgi:DMSO/TMAO reductase YedYZ molybdopterin-dependent catalytic subunit
MTRPGPWDYSLLRRDKGATMSGVDGEVAPGTTTSSDITPEELQLAARNHGMPLEALRYDLTPAGLHYLLVHYDVPFVDPDAWSLSVTGAVHRKLRLSLDDLRRRPELTVPVTMECAGNGRARLRPRALSQPWLYEAVGTAQWTGVPLGALLDEAEPHSEAVEVVFTGLDRGVEGGVEQAYERSLTLDEAHREDVLLAYAMNGQPLPPQHGYPLRLVVPGWYGMASVKWLHRIRLVSGPFEGYQHVRAYRLRQDPDEPGEPVREIAVRSLMVPPGIPDFFSRGRVVHGLGGCHLSGRAWSGHGPIVAVEVSTDAGRTWTPAQVDAALGPRAWHHWSWTWQPSALGSYELCCRATDAAGNTQPLEPAWNLGGYMVNAVQRVSVTVTGPEVDPGPAPAR